MINNCFVIYYCVWIILSWRALALARVEQRKHILLTCALKLFDQLIGAEIALRYAVTKSGELEQL